MIALCLDDVPLRSRLVDALEEHGSRAVVVAGRSELLELSAAGNALVAVLGLAGSDPDGVELCRRLGRRPATRLLCLLRSPDVEQVLLLLAAGADDCLVRSADLREVVARLDTLRRRLGHRSVLEVGDVSVDPAARQVRVADRGVEVTAAEFEVLRLLAERPTQVLTRRQLRADGWVGEDATVTVLVRRLREKLEEDPSRPRRLRTVHGVGYSLHPVHRVSP